MVRKLFLGFTAVALLAVNSSAQFYPTDARTEALGGAFIIKDATNILRYPAFMNQYADDIQVTFNSPMLGVKSLGKNWNIGVIANSGLLLDKRVGSAFYDEAKTELNGSVTAAPNTMQGITPTQNIPHLILGAAFGDLSLGLEAFYEYSRLKFDSESSVAAGATNTVEIKGQTSNPGAIFSANYKVNNAVISGKFGIGIPHINGLADITGAPAKVEVTSKKGLFMDGGFEAAFDFKKFNLTAGAQTLWDRYQFQQNDAATTGTYSNSRWAVYAGLESPVLENGLLVFQYDLRWTTHKLTPITEGFALANRTTRDKLYENIFSLGVEKPWLKAWIFDTFTARLGVDYQIQTPVAIVDGEDANGSFHSRSKGETTFNQFVPHIGLGVNKGFLTVDLNVNPTVWAGLIDGPDVGTVTATLKF